MNNPPASSVVAGVDFGSDSARVLLLDTATGKTVATASSSYPRWAEKKYIDPAAHRFRQHPQDYLDALASCFKQLEGLIEEHGLAALAVDTTGSTVAPTDGQGTPLALKPEFAEDPDAMFWMWKDRTSSAEADRINQILPASAPDFSSYQGKYSSEWWWAKILRANAVNPKVAGAAVSWVEHSDWLPGLLVGTDDIRDFARNSCAAGHKALYNSALGGKVPDEILQKLGDGLVEIQGTYRTPPVPAGTPLGVVTGQWAHKLGIPEGTIVGMGSLDAHAGAVAAGVSEKRMVKVVGTSTVDMFLTSPDLPRQHDTTELCGLAEDSIIPGKLGGEAGQAAFGDLFSWFSNLVSGLFSELVLAEGERSGIDLTQVTKAAKNRLLATLDEAAMERPASSIVALEWLNGRRYPYPDESATAALTSLRIGHDIVDVYKALAESAVLGSKNIHSELKKVGVTFQEVVLVGGIANKSPYISQLMSDALNAPIMVMNEPEVCAKGAAMYAAVAAQKFDTLSDAQQALLGSFEPDFYPRPEEVDRLENALEAYKSLGNEIQL